MIEIDVNGTKHNVNAAPETPLLYVLRDHLQLNAAKYGCGLGQCGACTVLLDDAAIFSCLTPIASLEGRKVTTLEGLGTLENPGLLQQTFIAGQAAQCGYCIPGMIMRAEALLRENPAPSDAEITAHMDTNLCRCGTHMRILKAVQQAVAMNSARSRLEKAKMEKVTP